MRQFGYKQFLAAIIVALTTFYSGAKDAFGCSHELSLATVELGEEVVENQWSAVAKLPSLRRLELRCRGELGCLSVERNGKWRHLQY